MKMSASRRAGAIAAMVIAFGAFAPGTAGATSITMPTGEPHVDANAPLAVTATGFQAGVNVYVEQCDGVPPTKQGWDPTLDCDLGSSPPAAVADAQGTATFPADDVNRAFHPFVGESPQSLFNCMAAGERPPSNGLSSFTDCKLRVSTNNSSATPDQVFLPIILTGRSVAKAKRPGAAPAASPTTSSPSTTVPGKRGNATSGTTVAPKDRRTTDRARRAARSAPNQAAAPVASPVATAAASAHSSSGAGLTALSDSGVRTGYILLGLGLMIAFVPLLVPRRRRRDSSRADEVTPTRPAGEGT
jgi:hypothetical protein